ncbi:uncharacterized protein LOC131008462 [Salvia miltiorrhiza]|uniref:uncharacterized protein LOC131008462 n=1 Tax=Salvia miltiorrhiza TaxID=226208 RepID=UPI0025AB93D9|nr:uncharacterized protein LOC131008462 [Salvia miltiorrhiza]
MGSIISNNQSAFVKGRYILDGVVILNESIMEAKKKKMGRTFFKIDFAKAYDSVEWDFLDALLVNFSFDSKWRKWMKGCLYSASASILVNGSSTKDFKMERGLRQGDPMSPFCFLIIAEGLNALVERAIARELLFMSGLAVNFEKSSIMGVGMAEEKIERWPEMLGCRVGSLPFSYLSLKVGGRANNSVDWIRLEEKVSNKIKGWKKNPTSLAGRITLVKSVLQVIPVYQLSFATISKSVVRNLGSMCGKFLWAGGERGQGYSMD